MCDCYCYSKNLYSKQFEAQSYEIYKKGIQKQEKFNCKRQYENFYDPLKSQYLEIYKNNIETGKIVYPVSEIEKIDFQEIVDSPLFFYKEFISQNKPCIILNAINDWTALENWEDMNYLKDLMKFTEQSPISVDITPDGFADSIHGEYFVQPYQEKWSFQQFLNSEENLFNNEFVPYIQKQNNNLEDEFSVIQKDINSNLQEFLLKNFFSNQKPDAVNFWMGYKNSVSAMHKDYYENFYSVIQGEKHFTLIPSDVYPFLGLNKYKNSHWHYDKDQKQFSLKVEEEDSEQYSQQNVEYQKSNLVEWVGVNVDLVDDLEKYQVLQDLPNYHVILTQGDMLYLPAQWYHQVSQFQSKGNNRHIIAINYWFDMQFDAKYKCFQSNQSLVQLDQQQQQNIINKQNQNQKQNQQIKKENIFEQNQQ